MKKLLIFSLFVIMLSSGGFFYFLNKSSQKSNSSASLGNNDLSFSLGSALATRYDSRKAVVTAIGRFRWKMTVEYEIQDENNNVLGSDVLIMGVNPGETKESIFGFLKEYLTQRAAVWLLAKGNYTLREESNDRITSAHFQKPDNSDDVNDHVEERHARKQLFNSTTKQDFPTYSITAAAAEKLQKPDNNQTQNFPIGDEKPGAGTEILRPDGDNSVTWVYQVPSGTHYTTLDEASANDTDYIYTYVADPPGGQIGRSDDFYDYYNLQATALTSEVVDSVDATFRCMLSYSLYGTPYARAGVKLSGNSTISATQRGSAAWATYTETGLARPGGGNWAVGDLNGLLGALHGHSASAYQYWDEYEDYSTENSFPSSSWFYVTVNYSAAGPTPTPVPKIDIRNGLNIRNGVNLRSN